MKTITLSIALFLLAGCQNLPVNECIFDQATFCVGQTRLESEINTLLDLAGSRSCVDVVHTCPGKAQCPFAGCGEPGTESGDWEIVTIKDTTRGK